MLGAQKPGFGLCSDRMLPLGKYGYREKGRGVLVVKALQPRCFWAYKSPVPPVIHRYHRGKGENALYGCLFSDVFSGFFYGYL
jgi:hypothetical protein